MSPYSSVSWADALSAAQPSLARALSNLEVLPKSGGKHSYLWLLGEVLPFDIHGHRERAAKHLEAAALTLERQGHGGGPGGGGDLRGLARFVRQLDPRVHDFPGPHQWTSRSPFASQFEVNVQAHNYFLALYRDQLGQAKDAVKALLPAPPEPVQTAQPPPRKAAVASTGRGR